MYNVLHNGAQKAFHAIVLTVRLENPLLVVKWGT